MNPTDYIFLPPSEWIDVIDSQATGQLLSRPALIDEIERVWGEDMAGDLRWIHVDIHDRRREWLATRERIQEKARELCSARASDDIARLGDSNMQRLVGDVLMARTPHDFALAVRWIEGVLSLRRRHPHRHRRDGGVGRP